MEAADLDASYGAIANALDRVGESQAPLFLATLVLDLVSREHDLDAVAAAIARAERLTGLRSTDTIAVSKPVPKAAP